MLGSDPIRAAADETTDELAARARTGDPWAFAQLYDRHWAAICRHTLRMIGGDRERARDLAQEAFTRAWAAVGQTQPGLRFRPWIYRIATNLCLHEIEKRRPTHELADLPDLDREGPDARGLRSEEQRRVWRTLATLPPRARQVLVLRELDDLAFDEIAMILATTVGNVQVMLHRARRRFADALGSVIPGEQDRPSRACPEFDALLGRFVDGELDADARGRLSEHLERCAGCLAERNGQRTAAALLAALPVLPVPGASPGGPWSAGAAGGTVAVGGGAAATGAGILKLAAALGVAAVVTIATGAALRRGRSERSAAARPPVAVVEPRPVRAAPAPAAAAVPPAAVGPSEPLRRRARPTPDSSVRPPAAEPAPAPRRGDFARLLHGRAGNRGASLARGARLRPGASLITPGFAALALGERNQVRTEPGTRLRLGVVHGRPAITLLDGELWVRRSAPDLHLVAGGIEVDPQGGAVRVRRSLDRTVVESLSEGVLVRVRGALTVLGRNRALSSDGSGPVALPVSPGRLGPVGWNGTGAPPLEWAAAPGARHYRVEIARAADFLEMEAAVTTAAPPFQPIVTLGQHYFRVLSIDAEGRRSAGSKIQSFFVVPP